MHPDLVSDCSGNASAFIRSLARLSPVDPESCFCPGTLLSRSILKWMKLPLVTLLRGWTI